VPIALASQTEDGRKEVTTVDVALLVVGLIAFGSTMAFDPWHLRSRLIEHDVAGRQAYLAKKHRPINARLIPDPETDREESVYTYQANGWFALALAALVALASVLHGA
jgi:hypothetical protein